MELQDRFYSAPEVANVLGVTLRSLYRYIRSGKIETFKTAGGRLRFTKELIINFMGPSIKKETAPVSYPRPVAPRAVLYPYAKPVKAPAAPEYYEEESEPAPLPVRRPVPGPFGRREEVFPVRPPAPPRPAATTSLYVEEESEDTGAEALVAPTPRQLFYQSSIKDLRLLAQKIQKSCQNAHVAYALTGYAGMSLHREMPPFSVIHLYVNFDDLPFFENILQCHEVPVEDDANLCFLEVTDLAFWQQTETFKGFKVAVPPKLEEDLKSL